MIKRGQETKIINLLSFVGVLVLSTVIGGLVGSIATSALDMYLAESNRKSLAAFSSGPSASGILGNKQDSGIRLQAFVDSQPFGVIGEPVVAPTVVVKEGPDDKLMMIEGLRLVGTLPQVGAWLMDSNNNNEVTLILIGQTKKGLALNEVDMYNVELERDTNTYRLFLSFRDDNKPQQGRPNLINTRGPVPSNSNIQAASVGSSGTISRELVDQLMMNPFDEMKKVRMAAHFENGQAAGIRIANIANDSLLRQLGVQRNDVIRGLNGIPIKNMGDIANAINSLMGGSRFEFDVKRGAEDVKLDYVVK